MNIEQIDKWIEERKAEISSVSADFTLKKSEVERIEAEWRQYSAASQRRISHLEGCIAELNRLKTELTPVAEPLAPETPTG